MSAFVVFSTPKNQYLYDRYSNAIVRITDEESIELSNILHMQNKRRMETM